MPKDNFAATFAALPRTAADAKHCVRWNKKRNRYELVVGGVVIAHASRLKMSIPACRARFLTEVNAVHSIGKRTRK